MNLEHAYERVFRATPAERWHDRARHLERIVNHSWKEALEQQLPKRGRTKMLQQAYQAAVERVTPALRKEYQDELQLYAELRAKAKAKTEQRTRLLYRLAELVVLRPLIRQGSGYFACVSNAWVNTYRSQGYGAMKYARGELMVLEHALQEHEVEVYVRYVNKPIEHYELWANCPDWVADAILRTITLEDAVKLYDKQPHVNPHVYFPMRQDEVSRLSKVFC